MQEVQEGRGWNQANVSQLSKGPQWAQCLVISGEIHVTLTTQRIK